MIDFSGLIFKGVVHYITEYWLYVYIISKTIPSLFLTINNFQPINSLLFTKIELGLLNSLSVKHPIMLFLFYNFISKSFFSKILSTCMFSLFLGSY